MSLSKRILINAIVGVLVLFAPWYIIAIIALFCFWKYEMFEVLVWAFMMDIVYGSVELGSGWFLPMLYITYITTLLILILSVIKKSIRYYS